MRAKDFVKQLRGGTLTVDEIGRGMHRCFVNASELIEDANLLIERRPARALSLAILGTEEIAKVVLLANGAAAASKAPIPWQALEQLVSLRSHNKKQVIFAAYGKTILDRLRTPNRPFYEAALPEELVSLLDLMKQLGFYVDVAGDKFISPSEFGSQNREWADWLIAAAEERLRSFRPLHGTEESSIKFARRCADLADALIGADEDADLEEFFRVARGSTT